jgi:hypothetical protein
MRRHHDMGGRPAGPIDRVEHDQEPWEKRVNAMLRLLVARRVMTIDEMRRAIEDLGPDVYDRLSYFERWISAITEVLLQKGVIEVDELGRAMAAVEARWREERVA